MIDPRDVLAGISGKLADLPDEKLLNVLDKLSPIASTPAVLPLMEEMRLRLRDLRPTRPMTVKRLLCRPFEDLFHVGAEDDGVEGRLSRRIITEIWTILETQGSAWLKAAQTQLQTIPATQPQRIHDLGMKLWQNAAKHLKTPAEAEGARDMAIVRQTLMAAPIIEAFKQAMPEKPINRLGEFEIGHLETALTALEEQKLPAEGFLLVVAARLANPALLLHFMQSRDIPVTSTVSRQLAEYAIADIAERADHFSHTPETMTANDVAREADRLAKAVITARKTVGEAQRGKLEASAQQAIAAIQTTLREKVLETAPAVIDAALPSDDGVAPALETLVAAEDHARALGRSRRAAALVGLEAATSKAIAAVSQRFEKKVGELLQKARSAPPEETSSERDIYRSIRMIELVDGPQRAQRILLDARQRLAARKKTLQVAM